MPPAIIDLKSADDPRDVVHQAVQALAEGKLVAFPTETVYGVAASALNETAVQKLLAAKGRGANHPLALAVKSADDALDYVPQMSPLGMRLARRCWPGPVTLVMDNSHPDSVVRRLPSSVQQVISPSGTVGLRVPAHDVILGVLRLSPGPLALTSANQSGQPDATQADQVAEAFPEHIELILDDGPCKFAQPSSVVRVCGNRYEILRQGVLGEQALDRLSEIMILIVCTGNTCRSPMGEALMKQRIADRLECSIDELDQRGVVVASAGIAAMSGSGPSAEAVQVMKARGLDIRNHQSQPLSDRLVNHADLILTMTQGHRAAIVARWPEASARVKTLCQDQADVSDPIGGPPELYQRCADQIDQNLQAWVDQLDLETETRPRNSDHANRDRQ